MDPRSDACSPTPKEVLNSVEPLLVNGVEACRLLAISRSKLYLLVAHGRIRRVKLGRSSRYLRSDLLDFTQGLADLVGGDASWASPPNRDKWEQ